VPSDFCKGCGPPPLTAIAISFRTTFREKMRFKPTLSQVQRLKRVNLLILYFFCFYFLTSLFFFIRICV